MATGIVNRAVQQPQQATVSPGGSSAASQAAAAAVAGSQAGVLFADLPLTPSVGQRGFITDSTTSTFYGVAAGSGGLPVPVFYDGSDWLVG